MGQVGEGGTGTGASLVHPTTKSWLEAMSMGMANPGYDPGPSGSMTSVSLAGNHPVIMSRPQVSIERLPARRMSNEPRESMNCKSCRKRKIKCNRLRPACEACQLFQCPCIYDAVPKKRGPKTDVLEALLKRVDGLEARLKKEQAEGDTPSSDSTAANIADEASSGAPTSHPSIRENPHFSQSETARGDSSDEATFYSSGEASEPPLSVQPEALLDTYFTRFHAKPFFVLDESTLRQRLQLNQIPQYLAHAIYAVAAKNTSHPNGYQSAVRLAEAYAAKSRAEIDVDEPSVDALQALMLLVIAFTAAGKGKKAYMLLANAVGMAMALELHRELDIDARVTPVEREVRRRLFWSCYLLDKFMACGSKRPSLVADNTILLRLPCWAPSPVSLPVDGDFFQSGSNLQFLQNTGRKSQGSSGMLIDICRILGTTNRYLAAGGVKGDSHFPWHSLSNLSKIRQDLDIWASGTEGVFSGLDNIFGQADSTSLVLSKLIYHLIHCLIYRPFLPVDLAELAGTGQHQSWQIEATNMCFLHANAIAELVELGKQSASIEWPAFVGYCICTAGTVHIHGAHYTRNGNNGEMSVFSSSADFLSKEMQQLSELRYAWASVQHQRETLQGIYHAHGVLVKNLANNALFSPAFHLEDFFDRYSNMEETGGQTFRFDAANLSLSDVVVDFTADSYTGHGLYAPRHSGNDAGMGRPNLKRKSTAPMGRKRPSLANTLHIPPSPGLATPSRPGFSARSQMSPAMLHSPTPLSAGSSHDLQMGGMHASMDENMGVVHSPISTASGAGFPLVPHQHAQPGPLAAGPSFSPAFSFSQIRSATPGSSTNPGQQRQQQQSYDPMFGGVPTNAYSSPAPPWHGEEKSTTTSVSPGRAGSASGSGAMAPPSTSTGGEEKDPFLSLLEQLAENESAKGPGSDLDFFLSGVPGG